MSSPQSTGLGARECDDTLIESEIEMLTLPDNGDV